MNGANWIFIYVGKGKNGLTIFDASKSTELVEYQHITSVTAFDVIEHPTRSNLKLLAGPDGLSQYKIDEDLQMKLEGRVDF